MFSDKVKIHAGLVGEFQHLQMIAIQVDIAARRVIMLLHMVEQAEFHDATLLRCETAKLTRGKSRRRNMGSIADKS